VCAFHSLEKATRGGSAVISKTVQLNPASTNFCSGATTSRSALVPRPGADSTRLTRGPLHLQRQGTSGMVIRRRSGETVRYASMHDTPRREPVSAAAADPAATAQSCPKPKTECIACKEEIPVGASLCKECKTPQDWTRHVPVWKDVGTAVLALAPLWAIAIAAWHYAIKPPAALLRAIASECQLETLELAMANDGDAPAILSMPRLEVKTDQELAKPSSIQLVAADPSSYPYVLSPKQSSHITLRPRASGMTIFGHFPTHQDKQVCNLIVKIEYTGFKGEKNTVLSDCGCPS
jgi:hypothetical protein